MGRGGICVLVCVILFGCAKKNDGGADAATEESVTAAPTLAPPPPPLATPTFPPFDLTFQSTKALIKRPAVAEVVDKLASGHTVYGGVPALGGTEPPEPWQVAQRLFEITTPDERDALLRHESPVVRLYVGRQLAEKYGSEKAYALLGDDTRVSTMSGCVGFELPVGDAIERDMSVALRMIAVQDERLPPGRRRNILSSLAHAKAPELRSLAYMSLKDAEVRAGAIDVLRQSNANDLQDDVPWILTYVKDDRVDVRASVARALKGLTGPAVTRARRLLAKDVDAGIRRDVARSLEKSLDEDVAVVGDILAHDPDEKVRRELASTVAGEGAESARVRAVLVHDESPRVRVGLLYAAQRLFSGDEGLTLRKTLASDPSEEVQDALNPERRRDRLVDAGILPPRPPDAGHVPMPQIQPNPCNPPYTIDSKGQKRYKPNCIK